MESMKVIEIFKSSLSPQQYINYEKAKVLIDDLEKRNLYAVIFSTIAKEKINISNIINCLDDKNDILVLQNKIGFVSGSKPNPFDSIYVYKTKDATKISGTISAFKKDKEYMTILMPNLYQEYIITGYYKHKHNTKRLHELKLYFNNIDFINCHPH
jgi:hypothetical protein